MVLAMFDPKDSDMTVAGAQRAAAKKADGKASHVKRRRVTFKGTQASLVALAGGNRDAQRGARLGFWATVTFVLVGALIAVAGLIYSIRGLSQAGRQGGRKGAFAGLALNGLVFALNVVLVTYGALWFIGRDDTTPISANEQPGAGAPPNGEFTGECTTTQLNLPDDVRAGRYRPVAFTDGGPVADLDPTGRFAVGTTTSNRGSTIVLWDSGEARAIAVDGQALAMGVNAQGTIVGFTSGSRTSGRGEKAWVQTDTLVELAIPEGYSSARATAINDHGDVAGVATTRGGESVAVVWGVDGQYAPKVLDAPGNAAANGIAADGTVVGQADAGTSGRGSQGRGQPYAWAPDGTGRALTLPEGESFGQVQRVRGDWAAGIAFHFEREGGRGAEYVGVRWNLRSGEISTYESRSGSAPVVNGNGDVIEVSGGRGRSGAAVLHRDGQDYQLTSEGRSGDPVALSDDATVILGNARGVGVMWLCG